MKLNLFSTPKNPFLFCLASIPPRKLALFSVFLLLVYLVFLPAPSIPVAPPVEQTPIRFCDNMHYVAIKDMPYVGEAYWPCIAEEPAGYEKPMPVNESLWKLPRANVGPIDHTTKMYGLYISQQRWENFNPDYITINEHGGTAGRAFRDNFHYVKTLNDSLKGFFVKTWRLQRVAA